MSIEYVIDHYTGDSTVNVYSSKTGSVFYSDRWSPIRTIPLLVRRENLEITGMTGDYMNNGLTHARIEIKRKIPYNIKTPFGNEVLEYGRLGDFKGFIRVDKTTLKSSASPDEKNLILDFLKNGVVIK